MAGSFYSEEELQEIGFAACGKNVLISRKGSIYFPELITIGDNVRIDDFTILSGDVHIGDHVHISAYAGLFGVGYRIEVGSFCSISSRTVVYAGSDDYSGEWMANPTVRKECRNVYGGDVHIMRHVLVGTGCTILPGVTIGTGASVGAMSLITKDVEEWTVNAGIPCRKIRERSRNILELEKTYYGGSSE